jgi:acyl carrier protein
MNADYAAEVLAHLHQVAPEIDPEAVDRGAPLIDQLDLDSMDVQRLFAALGAHYHLDIPEVDVPRLDTVDHIVAYLEARHGDRSR